MPRKLTVEDYRVLNSCAEMVVRANLLPDPSVPSCGCLQDCTGSSCPSRLWYLPACAVLAVQGSSLGPVRVPGWPVAALSRRGRGQWGERARGA